MSEGRAGNVVIRAMFKDACSGVLRLLGDVQRFGFGFQTLTLIGEQFKGRRPAVYFNRSIGPNELIDNPSWNV